MEKITTKQGQKNILMTKRQFIAIVIICVLFVAVSITMAIMTAKTMNELQAVKEEKNAFELRNTALDAENELHKQIYYIEKKASD